MALRAAFACTSRDAGDDAYQRGESAVCMNPSAWCGGIDQCCVARLVLHAILLYSCLPGVTFMIYIAACMHLAWIIGRDRLCRRFGIHVSAHKFAYAFDGHTFFHLRNRQHVLGIS